MYSAHQLKLRRSARESAMEAVIAALGRQVTLSEDDLALMRREGRMAEHYPAGAHVFPDNQSRPKIGVVTSGWACETGILLDGRRQIFSILLPGDVLFPLKRSGHTARSIMALTALDVADLSSLTAPDRPPSGLLQALSASTVAREERLLDHIVRLGRLSAYERTVHLLLELRSRLMALGLVTNETYRIPLTQEALADALGLSIVHVNRTLQQLRREKLIELKLGGVTLLKPQMLAAIAGFDARDDEPAGRPAAPPTRSVFAWPVA